MVVGSLNEGRILHIQVVYSLFFSLVSEMTICFLGGLFDGSNVILSAKIYDPLFIQRVKQHCVTVK